MLACTKLKMHPGAIAIILAGVLAIAGSFLPWGRVSFDYPGYDVPITNVSGIAYEDGVVTLIMGVLLLAAALVVLFRGTPRKAMAILALVAALVTTAVPLLNLVSFDDQKTSFTRLAIDQVAGGEIAGQVIGSMLRSTGGESQVSPSIGLWVALAGGFVGLAGGALVLLRREKSSISSGP